MSSSTTQFNPLVHLCFTDVSFTSEGCLTSHLKSSKTDPYHQDCLLMIAPLLRSVCAVRGLRKYLSLHSVSGVFPLYVFQSGAYLTRAKVTLTLRTLPQRLSIPTRVLCISQLQDWRRHYSNQSWSATLAYPNTGTLVKQLLHPLYPNSTFYPLEGSWDAGHIMPFRTGDMELATRT